MSKNQLFHARRVEMLTDDNWVSFFQADLCSSADVIENLRPVLVAKTVQQLVAFPRLTARDYCITYLCVCVLCLTCVLLIVKPL